MALTIDYRPQTFADIVGQEHIKTVLQQQIKSGNTKANYLFFGPRGTGKTTTARIMAKALNCSHLSDGNPCNSCPSCETINKNNTLDFVEIDAASHTGVDNIREEIIDKALYQPTSLSQKIYIIDEVHMLSKGAFNALLKIMEEPPKYMTFILATTEIHKIPDTVISRCQTFQFRNLTVEQITSRLQYITQKENIKTANGALTLIAKTAEGIMRDAIKYVEQVSVLGTVTLEAVTQYLGVVGDQRLEDLLTSIKEHDFPSSMKHLDDLYQSGVDLGFFVKQMLRYIDEHFAENPSEMVQVAELFSDIAYRIKYISQPLLAYKIAIQKFTKETNSNNNTSIPQTLKKDVTKSTKKEKKVTKVEKKPSAKETKKESKHSKTLSYDELKAQLLEKLEPSAKSLAEKYIVVQEISDDSVSLIAINKMAEISLRKDLSDIEKIVGEIIGSSCKLSLKFMTREDYFSSL